MSTSKNTLALRWLCLSLCFLALWAFVWGFGKFLVPILQPLDQAVSSFLNPDHYLPILDEFFRATSDFTNFLIAVPLVSLAVAVGVLRVSQMTLQRALLWSVVACGLWWLVLYLFAKQLEDFGQTVVMILAGLPPTLILLGAGVPALVKTVDAKRWITGLLAVETLLFVGLYFAHRLWWLEKFPTANWPLLPALVLAFGGAVIAFHRMNDAALTRYTRVFWLVILCIVLVDPLATELTKKSIARPRPLAGANQPWNEQLRPIEEEQLHGSNSYPSGHTSGTFALLTPLFWWVRGRRARAGILSWGVLQGVSRVYTVAHFTSDVAMGGVLGFGTGTLIFFLLGGPGQRAPREDEARA